MERIELLAALPDGSLLMAGNPGGDFRRVLRLDANDRLQTLHEDPRAEADLDEVVLDPRTQQPLAASYRSTMASATRRPWSRTSRAGSRATTSPCKRAVVGPRAGW
jgi:hypothetical protein